MYLVLVSYTLLLLLLLLLTASATGFVTFKTRRAQVTAAQMPVLSQQYPKVICAIILCIGVIIVILFDSRQWIGAVLG